jgi:N-acylneuraminate cytidylyltransferase
MIGNKKVLAIIPARGGSKGVPRKNIREIAGKPLLAWTIEEARKSKYIDRTILSSEDEEIINVARDWGCEVPFKRPRELASDETPGIEPVIDALNRIPGYDYVILLQPTSPLRKVSDIDAVIEACIERGSPACVSVTEPDKSPYWMYILQDNGKIKQLLEGEFTKRQDIPQVFALNGAVYAADIKWLTRTRTFVTGETVAYVMPKERSFDIDTELDFCICEYLLMKENL